MQLHITVADQENWALFCVDLLVAGKHEWQRHHGEADDVTGSPPTTTRDIREAPPVSPKASKRTRGRPSVLMRCWEALWKGLATDPRITIEHPELLPWGPVPLVNGQPITQEDVRALIRAHDSGLSKEAYKKYGRVLFLLFFWPHELTPKDEQYFLKYGASPWRRAAQQLAK